jgi:hypothetical protein|tara:strand:- start:3796 stop:4155 length:360 start_codon:yes stop_codon:yes gene_type:complete
MSYPKKIELIVDTSETLYFKDELGNYYALNYWFTDKHIFREFADVEPESVEKDEDGDMCYYWDDDSWEITTEILLLYIEDYLKNKGGIYEYDDEKYEDGDVFRVHKDDEWYDDMMDNLK